MTYIQLGENDYVKKCETDDCPNLVLFGVSRTHCIKCLEEVGIKLVLRPMVYFEQERLM